MKTIAIESIVGFNAVTAIAGGVGLMTQAVRPGLELLNHTPFDSYLLPGLILTLAVGGSAFMSFIMLVTRRQSARLMAFISGVIMCGWIVGEVAYIQTIHWLQPFYFLLGAVVIGLTYSGAKKTVMKGGVI